MTTAQAIGVKNQSDPISLLIPWSLIYQQSHLIFLLTLLVCLLLILVLHKDLLSTPILTELNRITTLQDQLRYLMAGLEKSRADIEAFY